MDEPKAITPEIVDKPITETGREKARRILRITDNIDELTSDDLLQHIFHLSQEVLNEDPKNAITFRVAIDAVKDVYKEIQGRPPKRATGKDESEQFLIDWGIINAEETV